MCQIVVAGIFFGAKKFGFNFCFVFGPAMMNLIVTSSLSFLLLSRWHDVDDVAVVVVGVRVSVVVVGSVQVELDKNTRKL